MRLLLFNVSDCKLGESCCQSGGRLALTSAVLRLLWGCLTLGSGWRGGVRREENGATIGQKTGASGKLHFNIETLICYRTRLTQILSLQAISIILSKETEVQNLIYFCQVAICSLSKLLIHLLSKFGNLCYVFTTFNRCVSFANIFKRGTLRKK